MSEAPLVLGFDSSAAHCAAALVSGGRVLACRTEQMTKGQAERLFPLIEELLAGTGVSWSGLAAIGVGVGPGNFTGIRIAVAAARGLALSLGIPSFGVSATEAAAFGVARPCRAVVPLRGDEVVWQDFGVKTDALHDAVASPALARVADLPPGPAPLVPLWPLPAAIALITAERLAACDGTLPALRPAPLYLRPADAAPPRDLPPVILP